MGEDHESLPCRARAVGANDKVGESVLIYVTFLCFVLGGGAVSGRFVGLKKKWERRNLDCVCVFCRRVAVQLPGTICSNVEAAGSFRMVINNAMSFVETPLEFVREGRLVSAGEKMGLN